VRALKVRADCLADSIQTKLLKNAQKVSFPVRDAQ